MDARSRIPLLKRTRIRAPIRLQTHRKVSDTTPLPPAAGGRGRGLGGYASGLAHRPQRAAAGRGTGSETASHGRGAEDLGKPWPNFWRAALVLDQARKI